jgi:hypothetical protein
MWRMSEFTREIKRRRCVEDKPCVDLKHFLWQARWIFMTMNYYVKACKVLFVTCHLLPVQWESMCWNGRSTGCCENL